MVGLGVLLKLLEPLVTCNTPGMSTIDDPEQPCLSVVDDVIGLFEGGVTDVLVLYHRFCARFALVAQCRAFTPSMACLLAPSAHGFVLPLCSNMTRLKTVQTGV